MQSGDRQRLTGTSGERPGEGEFLPVGQSAQDLVNEAVRNANSAFGRTVLVGLVGSNIQRSRTPRMHEAEGKRLGMNYAYTLIDTARNGTGEVEISEVIRAAHICGFAGLNVTYPHKQAIIPHIDMLAPDAQEVGAVNTVTFTDKGTVGHNTDRFGFAEGFRREMDGASLDRVLQFGAGGAGAAVASALIELGAKQVYVTDVDASRAEAIATRLGQVSEATKIEAITTSELGKIEFDGIVNTTPVGMDATPGIPIDPALLRPDIWVADVIYFPLETELLRTARAIGCRTMSGAAMAIFQAVRAFELFTGRTPDSAEMKKTFEAFDGNEAEARFAHSR